jgi:uncharacterized protein (TIGR03435 family)
MVLLAVLVGSTVALYAQSADSLPSFEVASIKPSKPSTDGMSIFGDPNGRLSVQNATLKDLIRFCYRLRDFQILGGPKWLEVDRYDIAAKPEDRSQPEQVLLMMQQLLADRFQLKFHRESKEAPVYELMVARNGPKLRTPDPNGKPGIQGRRGRIDAWGTPMPIFAQYLSQRLGRTVIDKTALTADYDFILEYQPDENEDVTTDRGASIFTAIQEQLGLRLQPAKGSVEIFVIDRAETPSAN